MVPDTLMMGRRPRSERMSFCVMGLFVSMFYVAGMAYIPLLRKRVRRSCQS
jgi:hypothetical protein